MAASGETLKAAWSGRWPSSGSTWRRSTCRRPVAGTSCASWSTATAASTSTSSPTSAGGRPSSLDEPPLSDELPGPFVLEVTSPGVDRPLTEARHWRRALSRLVQVTTTDGTTIVGRITAVPSDDEVVIATDAGDTVLARADVQRAVVQVEFNRADAADPDESDESDDPAAKEEE